MTGKKKGDGQDGEEMPDLTDFGRASGKLGEALDERTRKRMAALNETLRVLRHEARNALTQTGQEPSEEHLNELLRHGVRVVLPDMIQSRVLEVLAPEVLGLRESQEGEVEDEDGWSESDDGDGD